MALKQRITHPSVYSLAPLPHAFPHSTTPHHPATTTNAYCTHLWRLGPLPIAESSFQFPACLIPFLWTSPQSLEQSTQGKIQNHFFAKDNQGTHRVFAGSCGTLEVHYHLSTPQDSAELFASKRSESNTFPTTTLMDPQVPNDSSSVPAPSSCHNRLVSTPGRRATEDRVYSGTQAEEAWEVSAQRTPSKHRKTKEF